MNRRITALALVVLAAASMTTCSSFSPGGSKEDLAGPNTHTLVFGSITYSNGLILMTTGTPPMTWYQVNPSVKPLTMEASKDGSLFYLDPRPVGESWQLFSYTVRFDRTRTTYYLGFNGRHLWDCRMEKPGLHYVGSYRHHGPSLTSDEPEGLYTIEKPTELELLQELLGSFKKTPWQPVIEARIKEITG